VALVLGLATTRAASVEGTAPPAATGVSACRIALAAPGETQVLYGPTEIRAVASCAEGLEIEEIEFLVDGKEAGRAARPPFTIVWDAGGSFATRVVEARLRDRRGGVATAVVVTPGSSLHESVRVASRTVDRVVLSVTVADREGRPVRGLTLDDFVVEEEGREQRLETVRPERRPLSVAILLDTSSSTRGLWPQLRRAAPAFARTLGPEDAAQVVAFSGPARLIAGFTRDVQAIEASMARFRGWGGDTSLYDTLATVGVELAWGRGGRQVVVLLTDGVDTISRIDFPRLRNYLRRTEVTVETFLLPPEGGGAELDYGRFLRDITVLSRETGGELHRLKGPDAMEGAFLDLGRSLQDRYEVAYFSDRAARPGAWRSLRVRVRRRGAAVRTRQGVVAERDLADYLFEDLEKGEAAARRKAAEWLGTVQVAGASDRLLPALGDRAPEVRAAAAVSLGRLRDPRAIAALVGLLADRDETVRRAASEGLQSFGPAAVPALVAGLEGGTTESRVKAIGALTEIGDGGALEAITRLAVPPPVTADTAGAKRPEPRLRAWAFWSLGRMARPQSLPALAQGAADPDPEVRDAARRGLEAALQAMRQGGQLRPWAGRPENAEVFLRILERATEGTAPDPGLLEALGGAGEAGSILGLIEPLLAGEPAQRARALAPRLSRTGS
jgi:VWFA-related protein